MFRCTLKFPKKDKKVRPFKRQVAIKDDKMLPEMHPKRPRKNGIIMFQTPTLCLKTTRAHFRNIVILSSFQFSRQKRAKNIDRLSLFICRQYFKVRPRKQFNAFTIRIIVNEIKELIDSLEKCLNS